MADEILSPPPAAREPLANRWGLVGHYNLRVPISTSISQSGGGHAVGVSAELAERHDERYVLTADVLLGTTDNKIFPSTESAGTTAPEGHTAGMLGFGRFVRNASYFNADGDFKAALSTGTIPQVGVGSTSLGGERTKTFDLGTTYALMGEVRPWGGRGPDFRLGPMLHYGLQYGGKNSDANRVRLEFMVAAEVGYGDASARSGTDADTPLGPSGLAYGLFQLGHSFVLRYLFDRAITAPMAALGDYGLVGGTPQAGRGSLYDIPLLQAGAAFLGGLGSPLTPTLRAGGPWYWGFTALRAASGTATIATASPDGRGGGVAELLTTARLLGYAATGIETPSKRLSRDPDAVVRREQYIALASYGLNTLFMVAGGLGSQGALAGGGSTANVGLALSPDPVGREMVERSDYGFAYSFYHGQMKANRGGILIHKAWRDFPTKRFQFFSEAIFLSPVLTAQRGENYDATSDIGAAIGIEWRTTWTRLLAGIDTRGVFGGGTSAQAGIGGMAGADVIIPFNGRRDGSGISLGLRGAAHKLLPHGSQYELYPWGGATLHF
jgi:hypothetical protein